jgi:hypothetical protein
MARAEETSQAAVLLGGLGASAKGRGSRGLAGVLLAVVHLLLELLGLLLIDETQASQTVLELKSVEEGAVLVVGPRVEDFLIPDDATMGRLPMAHCISAAGTLREEGRKRGKKKAIRV